jgi:inhibitor of cysteine peptidase
MLKSLFLILLIILVSRNVETTAKTVKVGEKFEITVPGNPTTGYSWILRKDLDIKLCNLIGQDYQMHMHDTVPVMLVGVGLLF